MEEATQQVSTKQRKHQGYLGRVFDSYQNMMQIAACIRETARQLTIQSPLVLELSRRETGLFDYLPDARIIRHPTHKENQPLLSNPIALPYADKSFDCCLITDVYEHIDATLRPQLLSEMLRVTDGLVLVAAPQGDEIVSRFDRIVFDFIWGKYAERFEPLEQHVTFGLEPVEQIIASLKAQGADEVWALPCNYVYRWIHQILIYFDLQYQHAYGNLFEPLNRIYNERLSPYDYKEPCYRYLILVGTNLNINLSRLADRLSAPAETPSRVAETDGVLVKTFQAIEATLADQLRSCARELDALQEANQWAKNEVEHLHSIIRRLQEDNEWMKTENENLHGIVRQLQQNNAWALQEIEKLTANLDDLENRCRPGEEPDVPLASER